MAPVLHVVFSVVLLRTLYVYARASKLGNAVILNSERWTRHRHGPLTVTVNVHEAERPIMPFAVTVTVVDPRLNVEPDDIE